MSAAERTAKRVFRALIVLCGLCVTAGWVVGGVVWPSIWTEFWPVFLVMFVCLAVPLFTAIRDIVKWVWDV